jgi:hypothetical protein
VLFDSDWNPLATLEFPVVLLDNDWYPFATLECPSMLFDSDWNPIIVFVETSPRPIPIVILLMEISWVRSILSDVTAVLTNSVVASCVVLFPFSAVGAVGIPVNPGEFTPTFKFREASVYAKFAFNNKELSVAFLLLEIVL